MFTGLVQKIGRVETCLQRPGGAGVTIGHEAWDQPLVEGESVAVSGVCLTVTDAEPARFSCDLLRETIDRSGPRLYREGAAVNLERAMRADERLGGHIVQGHVDGTATVTAVDEADADQVLRLSAVPELVRGLIAKGSVTCDGVSLTIARLEPECFDVHIVPYTREHTTLGQATIGDEINVEVDLVGKYVYRYLEGHGGNISVEDLRAAGFGTL